MGQVKHNADVLIIGGGIAGIGAAAMLSDHVSVVLLETEDQCGYHTSGRSAAMYVPSYGGSEINQLAIASETYLASPPEQVCQSSLLSPRGLMLVSEEGEDALMDEHLAAHPGVQEISVSDALGKVPILRGDAVSRACIEPLAQDIDTDLLLQSWVRHCRRQGGAILTGQAVNAIQQNNGVWLVGTSAETFEAPVIVNAAGAWADQLALLAGVSAVGMKPCRRSAALISLPAEHDVDNWPMFFPLSEGWYAKPMGGKLMVSPADEEPMEPHDAFAEDMTILEGIDRFEHAVTITVERVEHSWAGLRTFVADKVPVVGWDVNTNGFFWLAGQGGYGFQTAPAMSQLATAIITEQNLSETQNGLASLLSPQRFSTN
ncbi:MAG: FAD-binding oxidoreductase [Gammaproteobacteria bacterium]|nr:FAD-binding oxidoreductase [Gammaproteobacteria bacterium]